MATLLAFTDSDVRVLTNKMKLNIDERKTFLNAVRFGGRAGRSMYRITKVSALTSSRIRETGDVVARTS